MVDFIDKGILVEGVKSIATSASTYVLTASETSILRFTGSVAQTVKLPDATTCLNGLYFNILNRSTQAMSVILNSGAALTSIGVDAAVTIRLFDNSTSNGTWDKASSHGASISLQEAYDAGNVITTASGTDVVIEGTESLKISASGGLEIDQVPITSSGGFIIKTTGDSSFFIQPSYLSGLKNPGPYSIDLQLMSDYDDLTKTASGYASTAIGGGRNTVSGDYSIAAGGLDNKVSGKYSALVVAEESSVSGDYSAVICGGGNNCDGNYSFIGGGYNNLLQGDRCGIINSISSSISFGVLDSVVVGGIDNSITSGEASVVLGGHNNTMATNLAVVLGGCYNKANYTASVVGGFGAYDLAPGDFVLGNDFFKTDTPTDGKGNFFRVAIESGDVHIGRSVNQNPVYELNVTFSLANDSAIYTDYPNLFLPVVTAVYFTTDGTLPEPLIPYQTYYLNPRIGYSVLLYDRYNYFSDEVNLTTTGAGNHKMHFISPSNKLHLHTSNINNQQYSVSLQAPTDLTTSVNLVLPGSYGTAGQVLTTDGSGNLSWQSGSKNVLVFSNTESSRTTPGILFSYTIPANTIKNGDVIEVNGYGVSSSPSGGVFAVYAQIEGQNLTDALTDPTPWNLSEAKFIYDEAGSSLNLLTGNGSYLALNFDTTQANVFRLYMSVDSGTPSYEVTLKTVALLHFKN